MHCRCGRGDCCDPHCPAAFVRDGMRPLVCKTAAASVRWPLSLTGQRQQANMDSSELHDMHLANVSASLWPPGSNWCNRCLGTNQHSTSVNFLPVSSRSELPLALAGTITLFANLSCKVAYHPSRFHPPSAKSSIIHIGPLASH